MNKIESKIISYSVKSNEEKETKETQVHHDVMNEHIERDESLVGSTYKIKNPVYKDALYVTINDIVLNKDTDNEVKQPFEVFINSKNVEHFQWVTAFTRLVSAVFRKGGDVAFIVDELKEVFDPKGGYYKKGGVFMPSLVAEIGCVIEEHLKSIGLIKSPELDEHQKKHVEEKKKELGIDGDMPKGGSKCLSCKEDSVFVKDGCSTCINCGDSKCG